MKRDRTPYIPDASTEANQRIGRRTTLCRVGVAVAALAATALAPSLGPTPRAHAATTVTVPFTTPGEHAFPVPVGVTSVHVVAIGGKGGNGEAPGPNGAGGYGATVTADLQIPQGVETLYIDVGGNGGSAAGSLTGGAGGTNGGGAGGNSDGNYTTGGGGGGGGASDVRTCSVSALPTTCVTLDSRLLVAAGGGGGGSGGNGLGSPVPGGNGGSAAAAGGDAMEGTGGGAGTNTTGGSAGNGMTGGLANAGLAASGGAGSGGDSPHTGGGGGGGGGGYYGGGGGGGGLAFGSGGGGGGSSYVGAPTTSRTIQGQIGTNGWYQGPVAPTLALTATDSIQNVSMVTDTTGTPSVTLSYTLGTYAPDPSSGITTSYSLDGGTTWQPYTGTVALPDGQYTLAYRSADQVGDTEAAQSLPLTIDTQAPAITATVAATTSTGWYTTPVDVTYACTDATSGVATCPSPTTLSTEGRNQSVTGQATDNAGNTATASASGIDIDLTPPHTSADVPANPVGSAAVTLTASDNLSGVAATHYSVDGGPQQDGTHVAIDGTGTHTLDYWSVDAAGNVEPPQSAQVTIEAPATPTATATDTPVPTATSTSVPAATDTPVPTATSTPVPAATSTPQSSKQEQGSISSPSAPTDTPRPAATRTPPNTPQPAATATPPAILPVTLNASPTPATPTTSGNPLASVPRPVSRSRDVAMAHLSDTLLPHKATRWHSPARIGRAPLRIILTTLPHATVLFDLTIMHADTTRHPAAHAQRRVYHLLVRGVADRRGHVSATLINHYIPGQVPSASLRIVAQAPQHHLAQTIPVQIQP